MESILTIALGGIPLTEFYNPLLFGPEAALAYC
jgi:hypothetical protein